METTALSPNNGMSTTLRYPNAEEAANFKQLYPCRNSNNPHMASLEKRKETFDARWNPTTPINATPDQIATAGFFYLGKY